MSSSPTETSGQLTQVTMPQMGVSVAEGTIVEWRKRPGDWVEADEPVCDVTTDKVDVEIPSPASGRLQRVLVEPGATVPVGTLLAEIDAEAKPGEAHPEEHLQGAKSAAPDVARTPAPGGAANGEADRSGFYSPVVRRIADKHRIDLSRVRGTGIGGRVRKKDLLAYIESGAGAAAEPSPEPVLHIESPYQREEAGVSRLRGWSRSWRRDGASRCRRCARRSPATWSRAVARRRTARRSWRPTSRGLARGGESCGSRCSGAEST